MITSYNFTIKVFIADFSTVQFSMPPEREIENVSILIDRGTSTPTGRCVFNPESVYDDISKLFLCMAGSG